MSTNRRIYLDFNATAPLSAAARAAMTERHGGRRQPVLGPRRGPPGARSRRAGPQRRSPRSSAGPREQVVFTSGGTEANALGVLALAAVAERRGLPRVVATTRDRAPVAARRDRRAGGARLADRDAARPVGSIDAPVGLVAVGVGQPRARHARRRRRSPPRRARRRARPRRRGPGRRQARPRRRSTPTRSRSRRTRSAARRASARSRSPSTRPAARSRPATRSAAAGPAPRTRSASSASAPPPRPIDLARVAARSPRSASGSSAACARSTASADPRRGRAARSAARSTPAFAGALGESIVIALDLAGIAVVDGRGVHERQHRAVAGAARPRACRRTRRARRCGSRSARHDDGGRDRRGLARASRASSRRARRTSLKFQRGFGGKPLRMRDVVIVGAARTPIGSFLGCARLGSRAASSARPRSRPRSSAPGVSPERRRAGPHGHACCRPASARRRRARRRCSPACRRACRA